MPAMTQNLTFAVSSATLKDTTRRAAQIYAGMVSPLWAPFIMASSYGAFVWSVAQGFKKNFVELGAQSDSLVPLELVEPAEPVLVSDISEGVEIAQDTVVEAYSGLEAISGVSVEAKTLSVSPELKPVRSSKTNRSRTFRP